MSRTRPASTMIRVSLALNVLVLVPVALSLGTRAEWVDGAFGERTPARDVLLAIYVAILVASVALLVASFLLRGAPWLPGAAGALLTVQIVYKLLTVVTVVDGLTNPVVLSNLGIAAVHAVTVIGIVRALTSARVGAQPVTTAGSHDTTSDGAAGS